MMRFVLFLLILSLSACGYHFPGQKGGLPGGVQRVQVRMFENLTSEPLLENSLTNEVIAVFSRHRNIQLVDSSAAAEAVLSGVIRSYSSQAYAYAQDDLIRKYRATMVVDVHLQRSGSDELLWSGRSHWSSEYDAAPDKALQGNQEQQAQEELSRRLAEEIFYQMLDDF